MAALVKHAEAVHRRMPLADTTAMKELAKPMFRRFFAQSASEIG